MEDTAPKPSLAKRALALLVLVIAAILLIKFVIGLLAGMLTLIGIVLLGAAIFWAWRQF